MIQIDQYAFDPTALDVSGSKRGRAEQGDVFADVFGKNFELASQDSNPSLRQTRERVTDQQVSKAKTAPGVVAEDEKGTGKTENLQETSEVSNETVTDEVAVVDSKATDQPDDSREVDEGDDEGEVVEENVAVQTSPVVVNNAVLLEQLAGDVKAQQAQQQVVAAVAKAGAEASQADVATPVKVIVPEPLTTEAEVGKIDVKALAIEANVAKAAAVVPVVDAADENVVVENAAKLAARDVASVRVPVEANVDQKVNIDVNDTKQEQVKAVAENIGESLNQDVQSNARGASQFDLVQSDAKVDSEAKDTGGFIAEVVTKEQKVEVKKADDSLMGSIREVSSAGKVDSGKGSVLESKPVSAEPMISREQVEQVVKAARVAVSRGSSQIQLRLNPPELGFLRVEIKQSASGLQLQLQATTPKAFQLLEQTSGHLRSVLESQGFQAAQIEVQLRTDLRNDQSQQQADQFNQRQGFQQGQNFSESFEDPLADSPADESSVDVQEVLEIQSDSRLRESWREIEFSSLDVVI